MGVISFKFFNNENDIQNNNENIKEQSDYDKEIDYDNYKLMIIYYSNSGTTKRVAELLQKKINADIYEIEPLEEYPTSFTEISDRAKEERESGELPKLKSDLPDISQYDVVLIGGPVWSRTVSTPIMSYLEQTDFDGKTVSAFWTDIGKKGNYEDDLVNLIQNGNYRNGLELTDANEISDEEINDLFKDWLKQILK